MTVGVIALEAAFLITIPSARRRYEESGNMSCYTISSVLCHAPKNLTVNTFDCFRGRMRRSETDERNRFKRKGKSTW